MRSQGRSAFKGANKIAKVVSAGSLDIRLKAVSIGETDHVEPVASPALAVAGAGEHAVDKPRIRLAIGIMDETLNLFRRGWQADRVEHQPADQAYAIGSRRGTEAAPKLVENERIDWSGDPAILDCRWSKSLTGWNDQCVTSPAVAVASGELLSGIFAP